METCDLQKGDDIFYFEEVAGVKYLKCGFLQTDIPYNINPIVIQCPIGAKTLQRRDIRRIVRGDAIIYNDKSNDDVDCIMPTISALRESLADLA